MNWISLYMYTLRPHGCNQTCIDSVIFHTDADVITRSRQSVYLSRHPDIVFCIHVYVPVYHISRSGDFSWLSSIAYRPVCLQFTVTFRQIRDPPDVFSCCGMFVKLLTSKTHSCEKLCQQCTEKEGTESF